MAADGSLLDTGAPHADAATADAAKDAAVVDAGIGSAPTLTAATASQVGLSGADLRIDFTGSDPDKDIKLVQFSLFDSANMQIGTDHQLPLVTPITGATGTSYVLLPDGLSPMSLTGHSDFKTAKITILDGRNVSSDESDVTIAVQPEVALSGACDPTFLTNRCASGLGCKGTTTKTCLAGEAPTLSSVGYFNDDLGPRILLAGTDPDGDVKKFTLRYLDAGGNSVLWDDDNDPSTPATSSFTGPIGNTEGQTDFYFRFVPSDAFLAAVTKVGITVTDSRATMNASAELITAAVASAPTKGSGATCDPRGFDFCKGTVMAPLVCAASGTSNRCTALSTARTNACNAAPVLNVSAGTTVKGSISGVSLWDAPMSCSTGINHPDSLVKLVLDTDATKITLSTDSLYTSFDTELYAIKACTDVPTLFDPRTPGSTDQWCNADQHAPGDIAVTNPKAVLVLNNLKAGSYFVIVDSFPSSDLTGNLFELSVTAE